MPASLIEKTITNRIERWCYQAEGSAPITGLHSAPVTIPPPACRTSSHTAITEFLLLRRAPVREVNRELAGFGEPTGLGGVGAGELLRLFTGGGRLLRIFAGGRELLGPGRIVCSLLGLVEAGTGLRGPWSSASAPQQTAASK